MKINTNIFILLAVFFVLSAAVYGYWTYQTYGQIEIIGFAAISMLVFCVSFIAFYLGKSARNFTGPEDLPEANIEDGEAEVGFYAPWSWWPLVLGIAGAVCFTSLAVGWWLFFIGFPLALVGLIGFVFEHSRGLHAH
ncbi:MAG: hypothetical protein RIQ88_559 [Actinomycetota bacterium]|jgi:Cytochrome c oxidase subunit IV